MSQSLASIVVNLVPCLRAHRPSASAPSRSEVVANSASQRGAAASKRLARRPLVNHAEVAFSTTLTDRSAVHVPGSMDFVAKFAQPKERAVPQRCRAGAGDARLRWILLPPTEETPGYDRGVRSFPPDHGNLKGPALFVGDASKILSKLILHGTSRCWCRPQPRCGGHRHRSLLQRGAAAESNPRTSASSSRCKSTPHWRSKQRPYGANCA